MDLFSTESSSLFPIFSPNNLDEIEKELERSARNHSISKEHRYQIQLLKQGTFSCTTGLWDEMSSSTEYNCNTSLRDEMSSSTKYSFMFQKFKAMTLFEFMWILFRLCGLPRRINVDTRKNVGSQKYECNKAEHILGQDQP